MVVEGNCCFRRVGREVGVCSHTLYPHIHYYSRSCRKGRGKDKGNRGVEGEGRREGGGDRVVGAGRMAWEEEGRREEEGGYGQVDDCDHCHPTEGDCDHCHPTEGGCDHCHPTEGGCCWFVERVHCWAGWRYHRLRQRG